MKYCSTDHTVQDRLATSRGALTTFVNFDDNVCQAGKG